MNIKKGTDENIRAHFFVVRCGAVFFSILPIPTQRDEDRAL